MKLKYVKPEMEIVKFQVNEAIASCGSLIFNHTVEACSDKLTDMGLSFQNKGATFVEDMESCADGPLYGYCYYTSASADNNQVLSAS